MKHLFTFTLLSIIIISCQPQDSNSSLSSSSNLVTGTLPKANGIPGRLLISVEDGVWNGELENVFKTHLSKQAEGPFYRYEPVFDYLQQDPSLINILGKKNRNFLRIILDNSQSYTETEIVIKKNHISQGQLYMVVKDSNKSRLLSFFKNELPTYISLFSDQEDERLITNFSNYRNFAFDKRAKEEFGISIGVPDRAKFVADLDSIIYALDKKSRATADNPQTGAKGGVYWAKKGIIIWQSKYLSEKSMLPISLLQERDSTLKKVVNGTLNDSYMATEYHPNHKPKFTQIEVDGANTMQIEGLWIHKGNDAASGGGPFIQYSIHHPKRNTIVHVTTYVFALHFPKRELYREVKSMLKTISLVD